MRSRLFRALSHRLYIDRRAATQRHLSRLNGLKLDLKRQNASLLVGIPPDSVQILLTWRSSRILKHSFATLITTKSERSGPCILLRQCSSLWQPTSYDSFFVQLSNKYTLTDHADTEDLRYRLCSYAIMDRPLSPIHQHGCALAGAVGVGRQLQIPTMSDQIDTELLSCNASSKRVSIQDQSFVQWQAP